MFIISTSFINAFHYSYKSIINYRYIKGCYSFFHTYTLKYNHQPTYLPVNMAEAEVNISNELTESNDINVDLYKDYIYAAITKIRSSGKRL